MDGSGNDTRKANPHEDAAFLAFGLLCGLSRTSGRKQLWICFSREWEDRRRGTDMILGLGRSRLPIDVTTGSGRTKGEKIRRNAKFRKGNPKSWWVQIIRTRLDGPVTDVMIDPCFIQAVRRLKSSEPTHFLPEDICPKHGKECSLVGALFVLGQDLVTFGLGNRPGWQEHFQDQAGNWVWILEK